MIPNYLAMSAAAITSAFASAAFVGRGSDSDFFAAALFLVAALGLAFSAGIDFEYRGENA